MLIQLVLKVNFGKKRRYVQLYPDLAISMTKWNQIILNTVQKTDQNQVKQVGLIISDKTNIILSKNLSNSDMCLNFWYSGFPFMYETG